MRAPLPYRSAAWWAAAAVALFLVHASCYLYFFVDDEGITLVYARNLIDGRGLTYAPSQGPAEGFSNFLHVIVMAGVLSITRLARLDPIWAFVAGGAIATACGAALVLVVSWLGGRLGLPLLPRAAAAFILALSAPLAVWSNSSLETVPFALAFMALVAATLPDVRVVPATMASIVVVLLRADGALFAVVWLGARFVWGDPAARRLLLARVAPAVAAATAAFVLARVGYFGAWLPLPLQAKVAHKLMSGAATVVWTERERYFLDFAAQAGAPIAFGLAVIPVALIRGAPRQAIVGGIGLAIVSLLVYVASVGDWMFGFRFLVPLLAPLALLWGVAIATIQAPRPRLARMVAALAIVAAVAGAARFGGFYEASERRAIFWRSPSLDPARRFGEYYELYQALRPRVRSGMLIACHEAGLVPFLLDVENVDMLGLTSRFIGAAPTRDAIFTDVGRYYPFTSEPAHHAVHAYLLYREPSLVVMRRSWMRRAQGGRIPHEILRGHYGLAEETASFLIYQRTDRAIDPARIAADGFLENVAHPAYAERFEVNGAPLVPADAIVALPSLRQGDTGQDVVVDPTWTLRIHPRATPPVHEIYVTAAAASEDVRVAVRLTAVSGRVVQPIEYVAAAGEPLCIHHVLDSPLSADAIDITLTSVSGRPVRMHLQAVRVMGQTLALRAHLERYGIR